MSRHDDNTRQGLADFSGKYMLNILLNILATAWVNNLDYLGGQLNVDEMQAKKNLLHCRQICTPCAEWAQGKHFARLAAELYQ